MTGPFPFPTAVNSTPVTPLPIPAGVREVVLMGGTFDPPHAAHLRLALRARDVRCPGAPLVYVPAAQSPLKTSEPHASENDRVEMLRLLLATAPDQNTHIWTDEIDRARLRPGPTFTIDTIERLLTILPKGVKPRLIIGSDQAADFHRWREARALLKKTRPIVLLRDPHRWVGDLSNALHATRFWTPSQRASWNVGIPFFDLLDVSSTKLREMLKAQPRDDAALTELLTAPVYQYIQSRGLYR